MRFKYGPGSPLFFTGLPKSMKKMVILQMAGAGLLIYFLYKVGFFTIFSGRTPPLHARNDIFSHFPHVKGDAGRITWAHGVNSQADLEKVMKSQYHIVEADIIMSNGGESESIPIMAHPPATSSDLTFDDWLKSLSPTGKGIKLDFKDLGAVQKCLIRVSDIDRKLYGPVIMNADIVQGPNVDDKVGTFLDPIPFLNIVADHYIQGVLSVGWTTEEGRQGYSWYNVYHMYHLLRMALFFTATNLRTQITFPVRASLCHPSSITKLVWLVDVLPRSTLTVWTSKTDQRRKEDDLILLRHLLRRELLYLDIGNSYSESKIKEILDTAEDHSKMEKRFAEILSTKQVIQDNWDTVKPLKSDYLLGRHAVVISGPGIGLVSRVELLSSPTEKNSVAFTIHGWSTKGDDVEPVSSCTISVVSRSADILDETLKTPNGIVSLFELSTGRLAIEAAGDDNAKLMEDRFKGHPQMHLNNAYRISVQDDGTRVVFDVSILDQYNTEEPTVTASKRLVYETKFNHATTYRLFIVLNCNYINTVVALHDLRLDHP